MSTLPGLASKGEKGKSKFQSLDINNLYKVYTTEPLETQQQKNTLPRKHGMQSLGKVPTARRPPANLPSLKSEHTGSDAAVSLVPSGGAGWGKQDPSSPATTTPPSTSTTNSNATSTSPANVQLNSQPVNVLPSTTPIPPTNKHHITNTATPVTADKSWSSVMSGSDLLQPPPYQSPQFQHEFPSLSAGDGVPPRTGSDTQYGPGPSLRPQTEGSWIQGGSRATTEPIPRSNSVPLGPPQQLSGQVGPNQQPLPPQFRGLIPPFMYRGNFAPNGHGGPNFANIPGTANNSRNRLPENNRGATRATDSDEVCHRPIIREEDLNRMDDIARDVGWASHDDIDYNQKLAFSDDEAESEKNHQVSLHKEQDKTEHNLQEAATKNWNASKTGSNAQAAVSQGGRNRSNEEEEVWIQRRRQHSEEVAMVIERAKQRKEEEEKRFLETKQAAAKKLQQLEEKINRNKHDKELDDSQGTINPLVVPPQPITPVPIPVPDWERDKENRSRTPVDTGTNKASYRDSSSDFRKLTQIEGRSFIRKETRSADRDSRDREQSGPSFSKQFQSNLPPRFLKQQQMRNNASSSPQPGVPFAEQYDVRWQQNQAFNKSSNSIRKRQEMDEIENKEQDDERKEVRRSGTDENYRSLYRSYSDAKVENKYEEGRDYNRSHEFDYRRDNRNEEKWEKDSKSEKRNSQQDLFDEHSVSRHSSDEGRRDKYDDKFQDKFERPQRPDSRDSRASRESRHSRESARDSEPREYHGSWADAPFEPTYDDRRKEHFREDRRSVPGPITKERIEAEDLKSEKKNLTQLKRGYIPERKSTDKKEEGIEKSADDGWSEGKNKEDTDNEDVGGGSKAWADAISPNTVAPENPKFMEVLEKTNKTTSIDSIKEEEAKQNDMDAKKGEKGMYDKDKDDKRGAANRRRVDPRQPGWGGNSGYIYHRSSWSKKSDSRRGSRSGGPKKSSGKSGEWHGTDSDVSIDEVSASTESGKEERSKTTRKYEKDEKNKETRQEKSGSMDRKMDSGRRDNYVPRGEPSRHGRGAGNFRSRGGLSKRIDGYGPPPSKSPFSHHEDKEKKTSNEESGTDNITSDEKTKQNQQALSAGIIGSSRNGTKDSSFMKRSEDRSDANKTKSLFSSQRSKKTKSDENISNENCDTSDNSDESGVKESKSARKFGSKSSIPGTGVNRSSSAGNITRRNNPPPRFASDKRGNYSSRIETSSVRQNSSGSLKSAYGNKSDESRGIDLISSSSSVADKPYKNKENEDIEHAEESDEKPVTLCDSDGFQEVKSKKTGQRQKLNDDKPVKPIKSEKDNKMVERKKPNGSTTQLTPQQIASIPSLMDTPINPPAVVPQLTNKGQFDRTRQSKLLPPRFAKQRENNRLQKVQMQQGICDVNDMNKVNHNINMYGLKDTSSTTSGRISNAWEKPLSTHLRADQDGMLTVGIDATKALEQPQQSTSQSNSPNIDKVIKSNHLSEKTVLDGTTPPVNTIIFENTNFKSAPGTRPVRTEKPCPNKLEETGIEQSVMSSFNKPIRDFLNKNEKQSDSIQMQLSFTKEDSADMKLDFFESELSHLTDDKNTKNMGLPRSIHTITSASNTISPSTADALNFKIASVKKVWESMPTVIEHSVGQEDTNSSFSTSFGPDPNSLDPSSAFGKGGDAPEDGHEGYTSSPNQPTSNNTTNVCKVKPTQQVAGTSGQAVHATSAHQQHSAVVGPGIVGHPLSPPPMQPVIGAGVGLGQPPQQYTSNQHIGYQPNLGGSTQYGMSAIPSPPTVLFNSTAQISAGQRGLYGAFQIDQSQVLGGQGRSQYSQYPNPYNLGQTASSPYSAQSMYLQGAQPHPPPTAQAPPDLYQNLNNYRLPATGPFGQSQQLNNPTTVLISSTSNSLMSATVKPSTQQISAIGTKASDASQAYQQQSQQGQQLYMTYDPTMQANYLPSTGVMQRGPTAPLQNNVALQPSSSYYTGSTGGQTGFYQQPGSSTLQSASLQQHQAGYGLQGNVFGTPNQSHTSAGLQNFSSHFLSSPMQIAAAAALNAQQYRSTNLQSSPYVKSVNNHIGDGTRPQQIKSPGSQQDVLSSVFNSGPQIPSPKSRQNMKQPPPQPSPTAQHKYNLYQAVGNQSAVAQTRYPTPIQRPVTFQPAVGTIQSGPSNNAKHRAASQSSKLTARHYYGGQGGSLSTSQNDKVEDSKLGDSPTPNSSNSAIVSNTSSIVSKAVISNSSTATINPTSDITKDASKDETSVIKE